jgi:pyridoxal phosphate enzyme (YggS family)
MQGIAKNIMDVRKKMAEAEARAGRPTASVALIAVTKTRTPEEIAEAVRAGVLDLGENRVQELTDKQAEVLPLLARDVSGSNIRWHLIGHLQRNKVKYIVNTVSLIHSVDSYRLAEEIDTRFAAAGGRARILIQVNPADEAQKSGVSAKECEALAQEIASTFKHIDIVGLMAVVPIADHPEEVRGYFRETRKAFSRIKEKHDKSSDSLLPHFEQLSMGMTSDYEIAIEEGATMVRVGVGIFGPREVIAPETGAGEV